MFKIYFIFNSLCSVPHQHISSTHSLVHFITVPLIDLSLPCMTTICLYHSCHSFRHALIKLVNILLLNLPPFLLQCVPHVPSVPQEWASSVYSALQILPQTLNDVHIWAAGRPIQFIDLLFLEPILSKERGMLQIIVLLKIYSGSKNCPNVWLFCKD